MGSPLDSGQFVRLLDERLREVAEGVYRDLPSQIPTYYRMLESDSAWEEFYSVPALLGIDISFGSVKTFRSPNYLIGSVTKGVRYNQPEVV